MTGTHDLYLLRRQQLRDRRQAMLRKALLPKLTIGAVLPRCRELAKALGTSYCTAHYDLRAFLAAEGISVTLRDRRLVITALPARGRSKGGRPPSPVLLDTAA